MSGIDHLVLAVRDLDLARQAYSDLGFTLTPPAQHPFGTGNSLVQFDGCFLELVAITRPELIPGDMPGHFNFAAHNRDFLARRDGFSMLVLESSDARADVKRFATAGLQTYEPFDFSRTAELPGGEQVTVGFSLAFATDPLSPECAFFTCQQHAPEHFWKPDYQRHVNGARTITDVIMVSNDPEAHRDFLAGYTGLQLAGAEMQAETSRGKIAIVEPGQYEHTFQTAAPDVSQGARLAAFVIGVQDIGKCGSVLQNAGISSSTQGDIRIVSPETTFGVLLAFKPISR